MSPDNKTPLLNGKASPTPESTRNPSDANGTTPSSYSHDDSSDIENGPYDNSSPNTNDHSRDVSRGLTPLYDQANSDKDEKTPLINEKSNNYGSHNGVYESLPKKDNDKPPYNLLRARIVSTALLMMFMSIFQPSVIVISQYLVHRWRIEAGHNETSSNKEVSHCNNNATSEFEDKLSGTVLNATTNYNYVISAVSLLSTLILGAYSDVVGRRPIVLTCAGAAVGYFTFMVCIMRFGLATDLFFVASAILGIGGSRFGMQMIINTVIADINPDKSKRVFEMAFQNAIATVTTAAVNISLGYIIEYVGYYEAALLLEVIAISSFLLAIFLLPETLPSYYSKNKHDTETKKSPGQIFLSLKRIWHLYTREGTRKRRICLVIVLLIFFFSAVLNQNLRNIDTVFQLHRPLCWTSTQIGFYSALQTGGRKLSATILLRVMQYLHVMRDEVFGMVACLFQGGSMVLEAFVQVSWQMYLVPVIGIAGAVTMPIVRGVLSFLVGAHYQGTVFASLAFVTTICNMTTSTAINYVYNATVSYNPGAVYFVIASFAFTDFLLFIPFFFFYDDPSKLKYKNSKMASP